MCRLSTEARKTVTDALGEPLIKRGGWGEQTLSGHT